MHTSWRWGRKSSLKPPRAALWVVVSIAGLISAGCGASTSEQAERTAAVEVDFSQRTAARAGPDVAVSSRPLRVGVAGMTSPLATLRYYQELLDYIGRKLHTPLVMKQRKTYQEINDLLKSGELDAAFLCSGGYVRGGPELAAQLLAVPVIRGKTTYQSYIIVHRDSAIREFTGLRGRAFAFTDPLSNTGWLYPVSRLASLGGTPASFFARVSYTYGHDRSIAAVAQKIADGAAVDSLVYEHLAASEPQRVSSLRVIERSPEFGIPPVVASPRLDPRLKQRLRIALLTLHQSPEGSHILRPLAIDRFVESDDRAYDSIRRLARRAGPGRP